MDREELKAALLEVLQTEEAKRVLAETLRASLDAEERKRVIRAAINEWLEDKYAHVGRWTLAAGAATFVAALLWFAFWERGWKPPH